MAKLAILMHVLVMMLLLSICSYDVVCRVRAPVRMWRIFDRRTRWLLYALSIICRLTDGHWRRHLVQQSTAVIFWRTRSA